MNLNNECESDVIHALPATGLHQCWQGPQSILNMESLATQPRGPLGERFTDTAQISSAVHGAALAKTLIRIGMFARIFTISVIFLLLFQVYVMAAVIRSSSNSTSCGDGETRCCEEDSSDPGYVDDEQCQSYSGNCTSGYVISCCYTVADYYYCNTTTSG